MITFPATITVAELTTKRTDVGDDILAALQEGKVQLRWQHVLLTAVRYDPARNEYILTTSNGGRIMPKPSTQLRVTLVVEKAR